MEPLPCPEDPPPIPAASNLSGWVLVGVLLAVLVYDGWAWRTGRPTISQWVRKKTDKGVWWKVGAAGIIGVTLWHLLLGGPL